MKLQIHHPHPALAPYVRLFIIMQGNFPDLGAVQHITPKGEPAIFFPFHREIPLMNLIEGDKVKTDLIKGFHQPYLIGQSNQFGLFNWKGPVNLCVVALHPHALHTFLGDHASMITNCFYSFDTIGKGPGFRDLQDQLWTLKEPEVVKNRIEKYLFQFFLRGSHRFNPTNSHPVINWINRQSGMVMVEEVAKKFRVTRRRLEQQFQTEIGLTPKEFARIVRFRAVAKRMYSHADISWMRLVADFNYTDQSHLIRDFRQFAGVSPTILSEERPLFDQLAYAHAFR